MDTIKQSRGLGDPQEQIQALILKYAKEDAERASEPPKEEEVYEYRKRSVDPLRRSPRWMLAHDKDIGYFIEEQYSIDTDYTI